MSETSPKPFGVEDSPARPRNRPQPLDLRVAALCTHNCAESSYTSALRATALDSRRRVARHLDTAPSSRGATRASRLDHYAGPERRHDGLCLSRAGGRGARAQPGCQQLGTHSLTTAPSPAVPQVTLPTRFLVTTAHLIAVLSVVFDVVGLKPIHTPFCWATLLASKLSQPRTAAHSEPCPARTLPAGRGGGAGPDGQPRQHRSGPARHSGAVQRAAVPVSRAAAGLACCLAWLLSHRWAAALRGSSRRQRAHH